MEFLIFLHGIRCETTVFGLKETGIQQKMVMDLFLLMALDAIKRRRSIKRGNLAFISTVFLSFLLGFSKTLLPPPNEVVGRQCFHILSTGVGGVV